MAARARTPVEATAVTYPIQLKTAYVYELHITRTPEPIGPGGPRLVPTISHDLLADGLTLNVLLGARATASFRPEAYATIDCTIIGVFVAGNKIDQRHAEEFAGREALVILWPYLRAAIAEMATHLQIAFPVLPTLDVTQLLAVITRAQGSRLVERPSSAPAIVPRRPRAAAKKAPALPESFER